MSESKIRFHVTIDQTLADEARAYIARSRPEFRGLGHLIEVLLANRIKAEEIITHASTRNRRAK